MKQISLQLSLILACLIAVVACDSGKPAVTTSGSADTALMSPASSPGRADNDEGVGHYKQGHWDVALEYYERAMATCGPTRSLTIGRAPECLMVADHFVDDEGEVFFGKLGVKLRVLRQGT